MLGWFHSPLGARRHTTVCRSLFHHPAADGSEIENRASVAVAIRYVHGERKTAMK